MADLHLEILRAPQRRLWETFQDNAAVIRSHGFVLAGGTALALQLGHRESHDFDFFSSVPDIESLRLAFEQLPHFGLLDADAHTIHADIDGVKVSFIGRYGYPFLQPLLPAGLLVMADVVDIALMKMLAITHRATLRDYLDLAVILRDRCSLRTLLDMAPQKYGPAFSAMLVLRTMIHFDDVDNETPVVLDATLASSWQEILRTAVQEVA